MPRPKSSNPVRNISVGLPATTHAKIERFNPRNRSKFFNRAVLEWMRIHDPENKEKEMAEFKRKMDPFESAKDLTTKQLANILHARLRSIPKGHPSHKAQLTKNLEKFVQDRKWVE